MTAKEKVLAVYPNAVCKRTYGYDKFANRTKNYVFAIYQHKSQHKFLATSWHNTSKEAWQSALNELIKQQLCTE